MVSSPSIYSVYVFSFSKVTLGRAENGRNKTEPSFASFEQSWWEWLGKMLMGNKEAPSLRWRVRSGLVQAGRQTEVGSSTQALVVAKGAQHQPSPSRKQSWCRFCICVSSSLYSETFIAPSCLRVKCGLLSWRGWETAVSTHWGSAVDSSAAWAVSIVSLPLSWVFYLLHENISCQKILFFVCMLIFGFSQAECKLWGLGVGGTVRPRLFLFIIGSYTWTEPRPSRHLIPITSCLHLCSGI